MFTHTDWHTDVTWTSVCHHVLVDRFIFISHPCHVRMVSKTKFVRVDYFETVKITDTANVCIKSVSPSSHVRPASVLSLSYSYHARGISLHKFTHRYGKDVTPTQHGRRTDVIPMNVDRDGQIIMAVDSIRMWCEFHMHLTRRARMQHGCDTDAIRTWHGFNQRCIRKVLFKEGLIDL